MPLAVLLDKELSEGGDVLILTTLNTTHSFGKSSGVKRTYLNFPSRLLRNSCCERASLRTL